MIRASSLSAAWLLSAFFGGIAAPAFAQTSVLPNVRQAGANDRVKAGEGLDARVFARRLGTISDVVISDDGVIYVADEASGRIFKLVDRGRDGRLDSSISLPHRFDMPSGLASAGKTVFVADRSGLWSVAPTGTPRLLAPFAKAGATDTPHPILWQPDGTILLGLNKARGTAQLLSVDVATGQATQIDSGSGAIVAFADMPGQSSPSSTSDTPWMIMRNGSQTSLVRARASGMANPVAIGADALSVTMSPDTGPIAIGTATGFLPVTSSITTITPSDDYWLQGVSAGPVRVTEDGALIADRQTGTIWSLRPSANVEEAVLDAPPIETAPQSLSPKDLIPRGSGIGRASRMDPGKRPQAEKTQADQDAPSE